jgi:hypothetical protein
LNNSPEQLVERLLQFDSHDPYPLLVQLGPDNLKKMLGAEADEKQMHKKRNSMTDDTKTLQFTKNQRSEILQIVGFN